MENDMNVDDHSLHAFEADYHSFFLAFPVSIIFHLIVASALIFGQDFLPEKKISLPPVINVSMVSLPLQETMPETTVQNIVSKAEEKVAEPETAEPEEPAAEPEEKMAEPEISEEKKAEPEKPAEKPKKQIKHKKPDKRVADSKKKEKEPDKKKESDEKKEPDEKKESYKDIIEHLKQKYKDEKIESGQGFGIPTEAGDPDAVIGRRDYGAIRFYRDNVIPDRINKNWAFSDSLTTRRFNLEAVLMIKIMPDGEITDILFKKRSGDQYFDDSAYKAVVKSSPLPQLPKGYDYYQVGLKFTPTGMN